MGSGGYRGALLLSGLMGSGKTSVGRLLARRLGWEFVDSDERVESKAGRSIDEIFRDQGEAAFRALERQVLADLPDARCVVALGGGAVVAEENRRILASKGVLVWLDAAPETLAERLALADDRPLLAETEGDSRVERLRALRAERESAYDLADLRIETDGRTVGEVCEAVLESLGKGDGA